MLKRVLKLLIILLSINLFSCNRQVIDQDSNKIKIVATIFPVYDWLENICKDVDNLEISLLLDKGVDLHNYQLTTDDLIKISSSDLFIYVGGESDEWVDDALKEATNKNMKVINMMEELSSSLKVEELKEGMQEEEHEDEHEHEEEYDEHIWLSLFNTKRLVNIIKEQIIEIDPDNKDKYDSNTNKYVEELDKLDSRFNKELTSISNNTVIVADRFPFRYLFDDYNIDYYAAFKGCSAETEASFDTVIFLANKLDELKLNKLVILESSEEKLAKTIIENSLSSDCEILKMNSMQSSTLNDYQAGNTYLKYMEENLETLLKVLK